MAYTKNKDFSNSSKSVTTMEEVLELKESRAIPERKLEIDTIDHYGAKVSVSENDGVTPLAYFFPVKKEGELVGYIQRNAKNQSDRYALVGNMDYRCDLGGSDIEGRGRKLFITEGPIDALSLFQALKEKQKGTKFADVDPNVWYCTLGAGNAAKQIIHNKDKLKKFEEIVLVFDNDKSTPAQKKAGEVRGMDAVEEISVNLGLNVKYVALPLKDCNDMLKAGRGLELAEMALFKAQLYTPELISIVEDIEAEYDIVSEPLKAGYPLEFLPKFSEKLGGIRHNEMTVILAPSGTGKSTLCKQIACEMVFKQNEKVACFFLEEDVKKLKQSFVAMDNKVSLARYRQNPDQWISKEDRMASLEKMRSKVMFYDCDKAGLIDIKSMVSMIRYCALNGAKHIFFDHLSFAVAGQSEYNDTKLLDMLMADLALVPRAFPVHIWLVAHINRESIKSFKPEVDEDKNIIYPYWLPIAKESGRSSAALEQCTWNLITLEPEIINENKEYGRKRIVVHKAREHGNTGVCDIIDMNKRTGLFEIAG